MGGWVAGRVVFDFNAKPIVGCAPPSRVENQVCAPLLLSAAAPHLNPAFTYTLDTLQTLEIKWRGGLVEIGTEFDHTVSVFNKILID